MVEATSADFSTEIPGREIGADPDDAFVELRQELGTEAGPEPDGTDDQDDDDRDGDTGVADRRAPPAARSGAVSQSRTRCWGGRMPAAQQERGDRRHQREAQQQRAEQGEAHRHRHGREQAALDALQGEQWDVGRDDDEQREEDRALDIAGRRADRARRDSRWDPPRPGAQRLRARCARPSRWSRPR